MTHTITINVRSPTTPFPHFWEVIFGSGRAILTLRDSYRRDLRDVKRITAFEYVRFHAIFHDEVGVYDEDEQGRPVYNFTYVDQIYDGLLENDVRPFIELSFMPRKLASKEITHPFWYKQVTAPPKDWSRWEDLVYQFTTHLCERYGADEVAQWYFEVWNEPNIDFWSGKPKEATYYELYERAARAIKRVSPLLRVGGPATAYTAWVARFIKHCARRGVPIDFVSTHVYADDTPHNVFGTRQSIPRSDMIARAVRKVFDQVKRSARPDLPIHWTECNASYMNEVTITDAPFMGPWLANTIRQCDGFVATLAYWTVSDVFEEQGVVKRPFYGGYGLIAAGHIPKASYNAFKLLHLLGTERIRVRSSSALATRRVDGSLAIAIWNYAPPGEGGSHRRLKLVIKGLTGSHRLRLHLLDRDHGSPLAAWEAMGRPSFPTRAEQQELRAAAELRPTELRLSRHGDVATVALELLPHGLALVEVVR
jgi:xylan 1,4-beta-xylosidase